MKVTRRELAQLIKEELDGLLSEYTVWDAPEGELDKYFGADMLAGELAASEARGTSVWPPAYAPDLYDSPRIGGEGNPTVRPGGPGPRPATWEEKGREFRLTADDQFPAESPYLTGQTIDPEAVRRASAPMPMQLLEDPPGDIRLTPRFEAIDREKIAPVESEGEGIVDASGNPVSRVEGQPYEGYPAGSAPAFIAQQQKQNLVWSPDKAKWATPAAGAAKAVKEAITKAVKEALTKKKA